ncbi:MAG: hypothetical protein ACRDZO_22725 [Egibacteraceae bacterium]
MLGFRLSAQRPPAARQITDAVVMRFDHVYEVDPALMGAVEQDDIPAWDTHRIVDHRLAHLDWMHDHWADGLLSAREVQSKG